MVVYPSWGYAGGRRPVNDGRDTHLLLGFVLDLLGALGGLCGSLVGALLCRVLSGVASLLGCGFSGFSGLLHIVLGGRLCDGKAGDGETDCCEIEEFHRGS